MSEEMILANERYENLEQLDNMLISDAIALIKQYKNGDMIYNKKHIGFLLDIEVFRNDEFSVRYINSKIKKSYSGDIYYRGREYIKLK